MKGVYVRRYSPTWATHMPILIRVLELSKGPVLELGMGIYSTPLLHILCENTHRELASYEDNLPWYEAHANYRSKHHSINLVSKWERVPIEKTHWGLVFIDHADKRRAIDAWRARDVADYVILHDSNDYNEKAYHYSRIYPSFKYRYNFRRLSPNTTILSNTHTFSDL